MVFSFFRKQAQKMPERPAARPRSPDWPESAAPASQPPESLPPEETPAAPADFDFGAPDVVTEDIINSLLRRQPG